jgi:hypothetical protein
MTINLYTSFFIATNILLYNYCFKNLLKIIPVTIFWGWGEEILKFIVN